ncbi:VOC family protein [Aureimonas sp. AU40]|uniref:VOC family protein n=1 Tax=Aureimonas sp. AU40 TaxID=1637747 RepID=UPI000781553C|nr:VOC family protein [Aureimonas sp. AU40]
MSVTRIVPNIATDRLDDARRFYGDLLGLTIGMDHGWIVTFVGSGVVAPQISFALEGGSGTPVPELSVEVSDLDEVFRRIVDAGHPIEYGPATEPWGVRRFFVRDPFGRLVNILAHEAG